VANSRNIALNDPNFLKKIKNGQFIDEKESGK